MKTGVIYCRYSSDSQTEQSIEGQLRVCNEYAKSNDIVILDTYIDRAMTGTNDNRPDFQRMIKDSAKKSFDVVLVYKFDRFSRNKYETAIHKKTLKDNGVKVISAMEYIPDSPEAIILESMLEGYAEYYSAELSQKVKRGMRETRSKGNFTGGFIIYGYKVENHKVVIDEEKAETVKYIFEQYAIGVYVKDIIKALTSKGIYNRGKPFARNTVYNILKNEKYFDNILCVTYKELLDIMPKGTLNSQLSREKLDVVSRGGGENNPALYAYSSLPEKYKRRWVLLKGEPEQQMRQEMIRNIVKKDEKAESFFEEYRYDKNGEMVALPVDVKKEYTWNASVLNALMEEFKRLSSSNNKLTGFRRNLWELLLVTSEEWRPVYGHSLPGSVGRLKALINKFRPDNYGVLVSGKYGNSNTLKIEEDGGRYLVALKRSRVPVYTDMEIFEEYNRVAPERGWKPLKSPRSLREWFNSPRVEPLWYDAVYGEMKAHQRYDRKHRTILPSRRDSLWYGDGTKLNLYYRDENGNKCTTSVYEVVDAYSEVLLGYYISDNEDYIAQYHAFRMAIQTSRHKPYEIVCDNQGGHKKNAALGLFSKISRIHRPTAPYNGESKTIENIFYRFQSQVLKKRFSFTGQNITAKRETSRPNLEFINANIDSLPTLEELKEQYAAARELWSNN